MAVRRSRVRVSFLAVLAAVLVALAAAGCGGGSDTSQVKAKVREFAAAAASHDYLRICNDILAPRLLADLKAGGITCIRAMSIAFTHVHDPRLIVGNVAINGNTATALTISQATGQKTILTSLRLIRTGNGWRILSLGAPVG